MVLEILRYEACHQPANLLGRGEGIFAFFPFAVPSLFIANFFSGIIALCWTKATLVAGLAIFSIAYGFNSGGILSLQQACAVQIAAPRTIGLTIGVVIASTSLSAMAVVPISGELAGKYGYLPLSIYSGVRLLVGSFILMAARLAQSTKPYAAV